MRIQNFSPRDHLLRRLSPMDLDAADERLVAEQSYYEMLIGEEQLLVESYVSRTLSAEDRRDLEAQVRIRPELRERVLLERLSRNRAGDAAKPHRDWMRFALPVAASLALAAGLAAWHFSERLGLERQIATNRERAWVERENKLTARIGKLEAKRPATEEASAPRPGGRKPEAESPILASLLLLPYTRGGDSSTEQQFHIPAKGGRVELLFNIDTDTSYPRYRISLKTPRQEVKEFAVRPRIVNQYRVVSTTLPATFSNVGHFEASVSGIASGSPDELIETYAFTLSPGTSKK